MKKISLLILIITPAILFSQSFKFAKGGNPLDGEYKYAYVQGNGGEFPYEDATLYLNKFDGKSNTNFYLSGSGYYIEGYSKAVVILKFSNEDEIFESDYVSYSSDGESLFLDSFIGRSTNSKLTKQEILDKFKSANSVYLRVQTQNDKQDYNFNLSGSSKAIEYVLN